MKTLYIHGDIITMNDANMCVQAICVENGKIVCVGTDDEILLLKEKDDVVIDLKEKTMLPSFIDAHSHFVAAANTLTQCNLVKAKSFQEIIEKMQSFIKNNHIKKGQWVVGYNYDHNFLKEQHHPNKYILDKISQEHPIVIIHVSSHMGVSNSLGLKLMDIDENVCDIEGGKYGRLVNSGELSGYMEEKAFLDFQEKLPMLSTEELLQQIVKVQDYYASYGITTVQDGMVTYPLFAVLKQAAHLRVLKLDVVGYVDMINAADLIDKEFQYNHQYVHHLKIGGFKIFLDGSPQGKTAWLSSPYQGEETYCGYPILQDEELEKYIKISLLKKQQLLAHCNGDMAAQQYIEQFEKVIKDLKIKENYRPVMIHGQLVRKDQLLRMKKINMIPSFFIDHVYYWGDVHLKNFGLKRGRHISPAKDAVDLNMKITFHQDTPVIAPDMLKTISTAVNRLSKNGQVIGEDEKISVLEALKAITINCAYQYNEENEKGSIEVGKKADLVILDQNPLKVDSQKLAFIKVIETIKEGKTIYLRK